MYLLTHSSSPAVVVAVVVRSKEFEISRFAFLLLPLCPLTLSAAMLTVNLSLIVAEQGNATFQLLGMASGPNAVNLDTMNIYFNDGANKLDDTPDSPGWKSPAPSFNP